MPLENVQIVHGDTDKVQFGMGTYGSRSGAVGMSAISKALDKVEAKAKKIAAHQLEAAESDIVIEDGAVKVKGTDKQLLWHEVCLGAYTAHNLPPDMEPGLKEGAPSMIRSTSRSRPAPTSAKSRSILQPVQTQIVQFVAADDFGVIVNPNIVEGQVHGGIVQGLGQAMLENAVYDDNGQLQTASYMDYTMPRADDVPFFQVSHHVTACPNNPLGMKGCGEAGAIGSPPALDQRHYGCHRQQQSSAMPANAEAVWRACQSATKQAAE